MMINHNVKSFFFKCTALYDSFPISRIFYEYITAKLITDTFIHLKIIVPGMSVMYTLCGNDLYVV